MSHPRSPRGAVALVIFLALLMPPSAFTLQAREPPSDLCALLPTSQFEKVLQETYDPPSKSAAPVAFRGGVSGTECDYRTDSFRTGKGLPRKISFIIYVDPSTAVAKDTFDKLSAFYAPNTPVPGVGDAAYRDSGDAVHVLKGKVRYYINITPTARKRKSNERPRPVGGRQLWAG